MNSPMPRLRPSSRGAFQPHINPTATTTVHVLMHSTTAAKTNTIATEKLVTMQS